jgi:TonB-linked SusC/RagA family outer membrane protein
MKKRLNGLLTLLLVLVVQIGFAQERTVTGTVLDESGLPLPGVNVIEKGTSNGAQSNFDGEYRISVRPNSTLVFSYVGFKTQEVVVGSASKIDVTLDVDAAALDEVVVTAYGVQKKESITGSITEVKAKELGEIQTSNVVQGLTGKVAGVQIINESGQPGAAPTVRFRGIGSINASSEPLYVVDGIPFQGNINSINNQDIASVTFLKDASAAALYGSRGANGVIILTTKKGGNRDMKVSIDTRVGFNSRSVEDYDVMSAPGEYYEGYYQAYRNSLVVNEGLSPQEASAYAAANLIELNNDFGRDPAPDDGGLNYNAYNVGSDNVIDPSTGKLNPNAQLLYQEDWNDYLFKNQPITQSSLSISGGTENTNVYFSLGHEKNDGYVIESGFEKYTGRFSADTKIKDRLTIGGSLNYAHTVQETVGGDGTSAYSNPISWARSIAPIYPVYAIDQTTGARILDNDGNPQFDDGTGMFGLPVRPYGSIQNPVATATLDIIDNVNDNVFGTSFATLNLYEGLDFTYNVAIDVRNRTLTNFDTPEYGDAAQANGRGTNAASRGFNLTQQQLFKYTTDLGNHSFDFLLGHETTKYKFDYLNVSKVNFLLPNVPQLDLAASYQSSSNFIREYNVEGYFTRLNYDFDNKYYLNASFRRDASSVFSPENRWGNFFGIGGAWRLSQEAFLEDASWLTELKLKSSYGEQGNDAILYPFGGRNYYGFRDQFAVVPNDGELAIQLNSLGNPDLTWETNANFNAGFEIAILDNRFQLNAEYFTREVRDMLFNTPLPLSSGNPSFPENVGDMENRGIELNINAEVVRTQDFGVILSFNGTHYENEITRLPQESIDDGVYRFEEGRSRYDYYLREFAGVDASNGDALWYTDILDEAGEPTGERETTNEFSQATEYFLDETAIPDVYGGFGLDFRFKNFDLGADFAYQIGGKGYDSVYWNAFSADEAGANLHRDVIGSTWTPENTDAKLPRLDTDDNLQYAGSSLFLTDASYLSLQNVTLGYNFSNNVTEAIGLDSLRLYALANNVALWSERQGYDPRLSLTGASSNEYSILRTVAFGVNVQF